MSSSHREAVRQKVVGCLQGLTLDPTQCRAQTDGAGNGAGVINRCAANFMNIVPQAQSITVVLATARFRHYTMHARFTKYRI